MSNEEMDRVLAGDDAVVPSSGFTSLVMEAVRRDAQAPPPIPFPWKRALPGLIVCVVVAAALLVSGRASGVAPEIRIEAWESWIGLALLVSILSVALSMRLARRSV